MDFQLLFDLPVQKISKYADIHSGHASHVWHVQTESNDVVVRTSRFSELPEMDYWDGLKKLFGSDPTDLSRLMNISTLLKQFSRDMPIAEVLKIVEVDDKPYAVVNHLEGEPLTSFNDLPASELERFGRWLASVHHVPFTTYGTIDETDRKPARTFYRDLATVTECLLSRYHPNHKAAHIMWQQLQQELEGLPEPETTSLILLDLDPTQFLWKENRITGLIDYELYALGPVEWDFVVLEYLVSTEAAKAVQRGYESLRPVPTLAPYRAILRFYMFLLTFHYPIHFEPWMSQPVRFPAS